MTRLTHHSCSKTVIINVVVLLLVLGTPLQV